MISDDSELLIVELCSPYDCVFLKAYKDASNFIYLYEDVFKELNVECWAPWMLLLFNSTLIVGLFCDLSKFFA